jgi:hypothetical protein
MLPNGGPGVGVGDADAVGTGFGGSAAGGAGDAVGFAAITVDAINASSKAKVSCYLLFFSDRQRLM